MERELREGDVINWKGQDWKVIAVAHYSVSKETSGVGLQSLKRKNGRQMWVEYPFSEYTLVCAVKIQNGHVSSDIDGWYCEYTLNDDPTISYRRYFLTKEKACNFLNS